MAVAAPAPAPVDPWAAYGPSQLCGGACECTWAHLYHNANEGCVRVGVKCDIVVAEGEAPIGSCLLNGGACTWAGEKLVHTPCAAGSGVAALLPRVLACSGALTAPLRLLLTGDTAWMVRGCT